MLMAVTVIASFPPGALAQRVVPPGNSAANQYTETFPTPGGSGLVTGGSHRSPAEILGARNARRLEALGAEGQAAAALAAATAPIRRTAGGQSGSGNDGAKAGEPAGSSGLGEVIVHATGLSSTGQTGLLLPLVLVAAVVGSLVFLWRQKRRTA